MGRVITIGRQFGSGGHEVGLKLAQKLGVPFYDKEILTLTAQSSKFAESYIQKMDEQKPRFLNVGSATMIAGAGASAYSEAALNSFYHLSPNDQVFLAQSKVLHELAAKGDCVIVGRCASYVLRDLDPINIFVYADLPFRIQRKLAMPIDEARNAKDMEKHIKNIDKNRSKYFEYYSHQVWGACQNYNLCIDTTNVGIDGAVEVISLYLDKLGK